MLNKIKNLFRKKDMQSIPLIHVHTFKSGEKLYTYSQENYGAIASRYFFALSKALEDLTRYGTDQKTIKRFYSKSEENDKQIIELLAQVKKSFSISSIDEAMELSHQNLRLTERMKEYGQDKVALQLKYQEILFTMFYLLEDEIEGGYNEFYNDKKLELINKDAKMRDVFFSSVQTIAKDLDIILEVSTEQMIKQTIKLLEMQQQNIQ